MPIYNVGDDKNKEVVFGSGDISVGAGYTPSGDGMLVLEKQRKKPLGTVIIHEPYREIKAGQAQVRMIFNNIESVDVVIRQLEKVKQYMMESR